MGYRKLMRRQHEGVSSIFTSTASTPPTSPPMATPSPSCTACSNAAAANEPADTMNGDDTNRNERKPHRPLVDSATTALVPAYGGFVGAGSP
jgi:hypothetical protein